LLFENRNGQLTVSVVSTERVSIMGTPYSTGGNYNYLKMLLVQ